MIEEYDIGREFAEAAAAFTEHGDETLITNFAKNTESNTR